MLLLPKRWKHRKQFRPHLKWVTSRGTTVSFGEYGLKATTSWVITNKQIEAMQIYVARGRFE